MDCPICFSEINATTGSTLLSCGHTFHLGCIATWLSTAPSCPCCRAQPSETETVKNNADDIKRKLEVMQEGLSILGREKDRLTRAAVEHLLPNDRKWFEFSKVLERAYPDIFLCCYAEDDEGNTIYFNAFLPDRIEQAQVHAQAPRFQPLYTEFMLARARTMAIESRGRRKVTRAEWELLDNMKTVARAAAARARVRGLGMAV